MKTGDPTTTEAREILAARFVHLPNDAKDILAGEHVMLPSSWAVNAVIAALNLRDEARSLALEECALIADFEASQWPGTDSLMRLACKVIARKIRALGKDES